MAPPFMLPTRLYATNLPHMHGFSSPSGGWSSIIGIVVAIIGNILISFALNTQRYAHIKLSKERERREGKRQSSSQGQQKPDGYGSAQEQNGTVKIKRQSKSADDDEVRKGETQPLLQSQGRRDSAHSDHSGKDEADAKDKSYLSSPWWWLGITLMTVGECGNFLAYGFAPASVVSPLGVVALVSNCLIAPWMLHESFRKRDALGVLIAIAGCVTVVLSASGSNPKLDQDEIWRLISTWEFETYLGITIVLIIALMVASNKYGDKSILIDLGLVGLFGGYTALSTKGVASLLSNTIWRVFTFPVTYVLIAILVFTAVMQIKYVNRALQRFDSTQVIPTQFVMFTLSVIIGSAILYRDFERKSAGDAAEFFAGCALTFLGVYCITSGRSRGDDDDDDDEESLEQDEGIHLAAEEGLTASRRASLSVPQLPQRTASTRSDGALFQLFAQDIDTDDQTAVKDLLDGQVKAAIPPSAHAAVHQDPALIPRTKYTSGSQSESRKPPPVHATTSEPILPMDALIKPAGGPPRNDRMVTPLLQAKSHSHIQERPKTPEMQSPMLEAPASTPRFGSIGRHSITDIFPHPGPYTNPLSNSLSAIVADSIRRGVGTSTRRKSLRGKRSRRFDEPLSYGQTPTDGAHDVGIERPTPSSSRDLESGTSIGHNESETNDRFGKAFGGFLKGRGASKTDHDRS